MFWSDARRLPLLLLLMVSALGLGLYNAHVSMNIVFGYRDCLEDPQRWEGAKLVFPLWEVTRILGPDRFEISKVIRDVPVQGDSRDLSVGSTISILGHFRGKDLVVVEEQRELHLLRAWKERLGILGFVLVSFAAPSFFRWKQGRLWERG